MLDQRRNTRLPAHHTTAATILLLVVTGIFSAATVHAGPKGGDSPTVAAQEWKGNVDEKDQTAPMGAGAKATADNANPLLIPLESLEAKIDTLEGPSSVAFSPDGRTLVTYDPYNHSDVILWDAASGEKRVTLKVKFAAFSPDGRTLATYYFDGVTLWDTASGVMRVTLKGQFKAFNPDGRMLATDDDGVTLWDAVSGKKRVTVDGRYAAFSPDGQTLVTYDYGGVTLWDAVSGGKRITLKGKFAAFSPNGQTLATDDDGVTLWDAASGEKRVTLKGKFKTFSPSGRTLATYYDDSVTLWDAASGGKRATVEGEFLAFSRDERTLSTYYGDGVALWDAASGRKRVTLNDKVKAFSPDGRTLVTGDYNDVTLWDATSGGKRVTLKGRFAAFSPDGRTLATDDNDSVTLWDAASGGKRITLAGSFQDFSPDGRTLATATSVNQVNRVVLYKIWSNWLNPDGLHATEEDATQALVQARDAEIAALRAPKGEFEPTQAYQARLAAVGARKQALRQEYEGRIQRAEEDWRRGNAQRQARLLPYSTTDITELAYDADAGLYRAALNGQSVTIPVPLQQAKALKEHVGSLRVEGRLRYHDADHAELVEAYLVDTVENLRFAFGI